MSQTFCILYCVHVLALQALMKVNKIVFKVIVIELFLILSFSAMACHLYFEYDPFKDLSSSFLSLFECK